MNAELKSSIVPEVSLETTTNVRTGINDLFWVQFLTKNPSSTEGTYGSKSEQQLVDPGKHWWNVRSLNNLVEQS